MSIKRAELTDMAYAHLVDRVNHSNDQGSLPHGTGTGLQCNQDMLIAYSDLPPQTYIAGMQPDIVHQQSVVNTIRSLAMYYRGITRATYGVAGNWPIGQVTPPEESEPYFAGFAYSASNIFAVNPGYHATHYNQLTDWINSMNYPEMAGNVTKYAITVFLDRLWDLLVRARENEIPDIRVCHSSCHSSCHSARGRR